MELHWKGSVRAGLFTLKRFQIDPAHSRGGGGGASGDVTLPKCFRAFFLKSLLFGENASGEGG